jgi:hypothetical protein
VKKLFALVALAAIVLQPVHAHTIGGAYASLISCTWGQVGYQYGYIGTYRVNGQIISQFFGNQYCPH